MEADKKVVTNTGSESEFKKFDDVMKKIISVPKDELFATGVMSGALPCATVRVETDAIGAAVRADYAIRPASNLEVLNAVVRIREVNNCFLKALRFLIHLRSPLKKMYQKLMGESSKLLPLRLRKVKHVDTATPKQTEISLSPDEFRGITEWL